MHHGKVLESNDPISNIPEKLLNPKHDILGKNLKKICCATSEVVDKKL